MFTGKNLLGLSLFALATTVASCGGGGGSTLSTLSVSSVTQDLTEDPDGLTTVVTFPADAPDLGPGAFESDGAQVPVGAVVSGSTITVVWDDRVTPEDEVRVTAPGGATTGFVPVTTTDGTAPTYTVSSATQGTGLGNDSIVVQFAGPRVAAETMVAANWALVIDGNTFPMSASALGWNPTTQIMTIVTDSTVNVHTSFELRATGLTSVADTPVSSAEVPGTATGDTTAPTLVSVVQSLASDEFGRVVEMTFSEAMDPAFSTQSTNFTTGILTFATAVSQPSPEILRATFPVPVVPTSDTVALFGLVDAHGNDLASGSQAVAVGTTVLNAYDGNPEVRTVSGVGGDQVVVITTQALDPDTAEDDTAWTLSIDSTPVDLTAQTLDYDLLNKTLTITLADDTTNGLGFTLTPVGTIDVDAEAFTSAFAGTVGGDAVLPTVQSLVQNRLADSSGETLDVTFDEDVDLTSAETAGNWTVSGGVTVLSAVRQPDASIVRLTLDAPAIPGENTVDVSSVTDVAGNAMTAVVAGAVTSTDTVAPAAVAASAEGVVGLENDTVLVQFDDDMIESEVIDPTNWAVESPTGSALDTTAATISYDSSARSATLVFDAGNNINFTVENDFSVAVSGVRDIAGNDIAAGTLAGVVDVERDQPGFESIFVKSAPFDNEVVVVFDEPVMEPDSFVTAELEDGGGNLLGSALAVDWSASEPRQIELTFGQIVAANVHEVTLRGVLDAAGNPFFAFAGQVVSPQSTSELGLDGASAAVVVSGEDNDRIDVEFDARPSVWQLVDVANFGLSDGGGSIDLSGAEIVYDGLTGVTLNLPSGVNLANGDSYTLEIDNLLTSQGVAMSGPDTVVEVAAGDAAAPALVVGRTRLDPTVANAVLLEFDEAIDETGAALAASYDILGVNPDTVEQLGPRSTRLTFSGGVSVSDVVNVSLDDLAGNSGVLSEAVVAADSVGPLVSTVTAVAVPGVGGDYLEVTFNEPISSGLATQASIYTIEQGGQTLDLAPSQPIYSSVGNTVTVPIPDNYDFASGVTVQVTIDGLTDVAGNAMALPAVINATFGGDVTAPDFDAAFVDLRESALGDQVLVRFDEDVREADATSLVAYTIGSGQTVTAIERLTDDSYRLTLDSPLLAGDTIQHAGMNDVFGNTAGVLTITPVF